AAVGASLPASAAATTTAAVTSSTLASLFWTCFKGGTFIFGTGLAIVPLLEHDVVTRFGWLTHAQFMDGLALGQMTPGPFVITVTFIGFVAAGFWGACAATAGMFLPAYVNALILVPIVWGKVSRHPRTPHFLNWSMPAIVGGIGATALRLGWTQLRQPLPILVFCVTSLLAWRYKLPAWLLILGAALAGMTFEFSSLQRTLLHQQ
ncbi:MAG: chromate transporter, partial [Bdellovibrionota bacterium]